MLGVVATLCVVALAARRGQLWFHEPPVVCAASMTARAMPAPVAPAPPADGAPAAIRSYLRAHFDEVEYRNGGTSLSGWAYAGAPLVEVRSDRLQRILPGTRFFTTKVLTGQIEFPTIDNLVSFRHGSQQDDVRSMLSPPSGRPSHKFFRQFLGVEAPTMRQREEVALALAELLAAAKYEGAARPLPSRGGRARAALWATGVHWRDIEIGSNRVGLVHQVFISNPLDRSDVEIFSDASVFTDSLP